MDILTLALIALAGLAVVVITVALSRYREAERRADERAKVFQSELLENLKNPREDS